MEIDVLALDAMVAALRDYRRWQGAALGEHPKPGPAEHMTDEARLRDIGRATSTPVKDGLRNADGSVLTRYVEWRGCRFWAPTAAAQ